jgi:hypothetical protein
MLGDHGTSSINLNEKLSTISSVLEASLLFFLSRKIVSNLLVLDKQFFLYSYLTDNPTLQKARKLNEEFGLICI